MLNCFLCFFGHVALWFGKSMFCSEGFACLFTVLRPLHWFPICNLPAILWSLSLSLPSHFQIFLQFFLFFVILYLCVSRISSQYACSILKVWKPNSGERWVPSTRARTHTHTHTQTHTHTATMSTWWAQQELNWMSFHLVLCCCVCVSVCVCVAEPLVKTNFHCEHAVVGFKTSLKLFNYQLSGNARKYSLIRDFNQQRKPPTV